MIQKSTSPMTTNDRWLISCHEAGHAVGAIVLGGACDGVLLSVDSGQAHCRDLLGNNNAYMTACGPSAESLAEQFDAPICEPVSFETIAKNPPETASHEFAAWCGVADVIGINRKFESDSRSLALWAISGIESEPEKWAGRVAFARHVANQIIETNKSAVIRVARALYERGALTGEQIKQLFEE